MCQSWDYGDVIKDLEVVSKIRVTFYCDVGNIMEYVSDES